jgi:hypothetical protein
MQVLQDRPLQSPEADALTPIETAKNSWVFLARRAVFVGMCFINGLTLGVAAYVMFPLTSYLLFGDLKFWKHIRHFHKLTLTSYHLFFSLLGQPHYSEVFQIGWSAPPRMTPDLSKMTLSRRWAEEKGASCSGCITCCVIPGCNLIERKSNNCLLYGSFFWKYFRCGSFPENQRQAEYYQCEKWRQIGTHSEA